MKPNFAAALSGDKRALKVAGAAALALAVVAGVAHAGTTGTEFQEAYDTIVGWVDGYLGKSIAIAFFVFGLFMGVARQNLISCGVAIVVAFGLLIVPDILDNVLTVTLTDATISASVDGAVLGVPSGEVLDGAYTVLN